MRVRNSGFKIRSLIWLGAMLAHGVLIGAPTNAEPAGRIPKLTPPYGELPPTFWEQHGTTIIVAGIGVVLLAAVGILLWLRPKPVVVIPPDVQARQALYPLLQQPEDGALLSRVSQILRRYIIAVFKLPTGELTTTEFCRAIAAQDSVGAELASALVDFLRACDQRKFSSSSSEKALGATARALALIAQAETRRAQLASPPASDANPTLKGQ